MRFDTDTVLIVGLFLAGLGTQVSGIHAWSEALSPAFVGGTLMTLGAILRAYYKVPAPPKE